jgi:hypothetical protein
VRILEGARDFFFFKTVHTGSGAHLTYSMGTEILFGVKTAGA